MKSKSVIRREQIQAEELAKELYASKHLLNDNDELLLMAILQTFQEGKEITETSLQNLQRMKGIIG